MVNPDSIPTLISRCSLCSGRSSCRSK